MQILGALPSKTVIERAEWEGSEYVLHIRLPDGKRHGVRGTVMQKVWSAMCDWVLDYEAGKVKG
jgi:hypothetical protein